MTYSTRDSYIGTDLFLRGSWEPHLTSFLGAFDFAGTTAIDVGANIGVYTMRLSDAVGPSGSVIALEPDPQTAEWLARNVAQNSCSNVTVVQAAAGRESDTASFSRDMVNRGNHRIVGEDEPHDLTVDVVTIDSLTKPLPENQVSFIKIDVQGFELEVLEGLSDTLRRNPAAIVQLELNADRLGRAAEIVRLLREVGWDGFEIHRGRFMPMQDPSAYEWPVFRSECDLLLASNPQRLRDQIVTRLQDHHRSV